MKKVYNYVKLREGILSDKYMFYDIPEYYADNIFIKNRIHVKFGKEFKNPKYPYTVIFCSVRKGDSDVFRACMGELVIKMLVCGKIDYIDFCEKMFDAFNSGN